MNVSSLRTYITLIEQASRPTVVVPEPPVFDGKIDFDPAKTRLLFDLDLKADDGTITPEEIRAFGLMLHRNRNRYIRMYHGTASKHPVMDTGLLPTSATRRRSIQSGSGYVYLAYDPNRALSFAQHGYPGLPLTVYSVVVPVRALKPDPDQLKNLRLWAEKSMGDTLADSMIYGGGARVKGAVPPHGVTPHSRYDERRQRID